MSYRVVPVPMSIVSRVREEMQDPVYKHPASVKTATSYGPCRNCLDFFNVGVDRRILFTYDAFLGLDDKRLPGPVFIHEQECEPYKAADFPMHLAEHSLTLEAFGKGNDLRETHYSSNERVDAIIERCFARRDVDYIIVRDTDAGCFDCAIVRE